MRTSPIAVYVDTEMSKEETMVYCETGKRGPYVCIKRELIKKAAYKAYRAYTKDIQYDRSKQAHDRQFGRIGTKKRKDKGSHTKEYTINDRGSAEELVVSFKEQAIPFEVTIPSIQESALEDFELEFRIWICSPSSTGKYR